MRIWWDKRRNQNSLECCGIYYIKPIEKYCFSCKGNTANKLSCSARRTEQGRLVLVSNFAIWGKKKSRFIKNQEASSRLEPH